MNNSPIFMAQEHFNVLESDLIARPSELILSALISCYNLAVFNSWSLKA